jgi:DNA-binding beta-propeller fold protein YncE
VGENMVDAVVGLLMPTRIPPERQHLAAWTQPLHSPLALALDPSKNLLFISQQPEGEAVPLLAVIMDADHDGTLDDAATWSMTDLALPEGALLEGPSDIAFDAATRTLLVVDEKAHCVKRLDLEGGGTVEVAGRCGFPGPFHGYLDSPSHLAVAPTGTIYISDTGNNRVMRVRVDGPEEQRLTVVVGDGSRSSAGDGAPASGFPMDSPQQLALDSRGNLYVASRTTVRVIARVDGSTDADGRGYVKTLYPDHHGADAFPDNASLCVSGLALEDDDHILVADACQGFMLRLSRTVGSAP